MTVVESKRVGLTQVITVNRPKALNAINVAVLEGLEQAFNALEADIRAVVLTGGGDKAFVAGADIQGMSEFSVVDAEAFALRGQQLLNHIGKLHCPVIAAVNGYALGGGCELAMGCDFIIASDKALFGQPEVSLGVIPGFGGTQRLIRRVGISTAMDLCLTGRLIKAEEALSIGLVSRVVSGDVLEAALSVAEEIGKKGPVAVRLAKRAIVENSDESLASGLAAEASLFAMCFSTEDQKEGMAAFLEKRKASFTGQ